LRRVCLRITQTPVPKPQPISAGSWATTYSSPDMPLRCASNVFLSWMMGIMLGLMWACWKMTALLDVRSKKGDWAK